MSAESKYCVYYEGKWLYTDDLNAVREILGVEVPKKPYPCPKCGSTNVLYDASKRESECLKCKHKWKAEP